MNTADLVRWSFGLAVLSAIGAAAASGTIGVRLAVGAVGAVVLLAIHPGLFLLLGLLGYAAGQSILSGADVYGSVNLSQLWIGGISAALLVRVFLVGALRGGLPRIPRSVLVHGAFLAWTAIRAVNSPGSAAWVSVMRVGASIVITYVAFAMAQKYGKWFLWSVGSVSIIAGVTAAIDAARGVGPQIVLMRGAIRAAGSFGGPVATATVAMVGLPVFVRHVMKRNTPFELSRIFGVTGFVAMTMAAGFTLTRTMFVGVFLFGILMMLLDESKDMGVRQRRVLVALIPVVIFLGALRLAPEQYVEARLRDVPGVGSGVSLTANAGSGRGMIWSNTVAMLLESEPMEWLVGHGTAAVRDDLRNRIGVFKNAHNSYLEVAYDLGCIGVVLYLLLLWATYKDIIPFPRSEDERQWRLVGRAYFVAYCLSTIMFNGYVFSVGPRWFTFMLLGTLFGGSPWRAWGQEIDA